jgi:transcriptional antiterminator
VTYNTDRLFEEIAYIAYHFHWSLEEILDLEHPLRQRFVEEIGRINRRLAEEE